MTKAINPHNGRELALLMKGHKDVALFDAIVPKTGLVGQKKIPTNMFRPYVETEDLVLSIRHYPASDFEEGALGDRRFVLYARKGKETLIDDFYKLLEEHKGHGDAYHRAVGELLGYNKDQIDAFLAEIND